MNMTVRFASPLLILGLAVAPAAFAQDSQGQPPQAAGAQQEQGTSWADLDTDGNGTLSKQEADSHPGLASVFTQADADGDGQLTADEYRAFVEKQQSGAADSAP
jgi:hypothetical protein